MSIEKLFPGKKSQWLPLYRRLLARLTRVPGIEVKQSARSLAIGRAGSIRVQVRGLEIGLCLSGAPFRSSRLKPSGSKRITHRVLIREASEIDEELIAWIRAAQQRATRATRAKARTSRRKSP